MPRKRRRKALKPHWFQILLTLADQDLHGLQIMEEVSARTDGSVHLWPGMLYGSLKTMHEEGLVNEIEVPETEKIAGGRPRYYSITKSGHRVLVAEIKRLSSYLDAAREKNLLHGRDA